MPAQESTPIDTALLDIILAIQLTVGWAGEKGEEPPRLRWWETDLVDEDAGGDFFKRLAPRSHLWAALQAAREAARCKDEELRKKTDDPDVILSLFHLGFEIEEQLEQRLLDLKREARPPAEALPRLFPISEGFDREKLTRHLSGATSVSFRETPTGRRLDGKPPVELATLIETLAAGFIPLEESGIYPLPHYRVSP